MKKLLKGLYAAIPFKKELFTLIRVFNPPHKIYQHLHFKGVFSVPVGKSSFKITHHGFGLENDLFWKGIKGEWEAKSLALWCTLSEMSTTIFDIGANTGGYSLLAKTVNPTASVYAFEPVKRTYKFMLQNFALNHYKVTSVEKAASNKDGTALIGDNIEDEHQYGATLSPKFITGSTYEVETITLNTYIKKEGIEKIDLMKIDVEAFEPEVLEGFSGYLYKFMPTMLIEFVQEEPAARINEMLRGSGYLYFNIKEKEGPRLVDTITKSDHFNFLICTRVVARELGLVTA